MHLRRLFGSRAKNLTMDTINPKVIDAKYAVRGTIVDKMNQMKKDIAAGNASYKFDKFCETNIGNPHYFRQQPITFTREVMSAVLNPDLITKKVYNADVNRRAQEYLD
jgi:alanine transaminase